MKSKDRPYVICHMMPTLDGRIVTDTWALTDHTKVYEKVHAKHDADAWIIGRVSMDPIGGGGKTRAPKRKSVAKIPRADFVANAKAKSFAIAVDPSGKIAWKTNHVDDDHFVTVLTEKVSDSYLAFLQERGVSYVFGGKAKLDLALVLRKLHALFGIEKLLLEGGGNVNGSFLNAGLIDELSVIIAPLADGRVGTPTLFDAPGIQGKARGLKLIATKTFKKKYVWLRYDVVSK